MGYVHNALRHRGAEIVQTLSNLCQCYFNSLSQWAWNGPLMGSGWAVGNDSSRVIMGSVQSVAQILGIEYFLLLCTRGASFLGPVAA